MRILYRNKFSLRPILINESSYDLTTQTFKFGRIKVQYFYSINSILVSCCNGIDTHLIQSNIYIFKPSLPYSKPMPYHTNNQYTNNCLLHYRRPHTTNDQGG